MFAKHLNKNCVKYLASQKPCDISQHYSVLRISVATVERWGGTQHNYFCKAHKIVPGRRNLRNDGVDCCRAVMAMSKQGQGLWMTGCVGLLRVCARAHAHPRACACGETPVMHFPICLSDCGWRRMCGCTSGWVGRPHESVHRSQFISRRKQNVDRSWLQVVSRIFVYCFVFVSSSHLKQ